MIIVDVHSFVVLVVIVVAHSVDLCKLPDGLDELVGGTGELWLEERQPEDLSIDALGQDFADLTFQICVDDVFHVYRVEVVCPRMQHLEALVLDLLFPVSLNIVLEELERRLVRLDRVAEVVLHDGLAFSQECADRLDARRALQILRVDQLFEILVESD